MPASMMMAASGVDLNVAGSSSDIAPTGPMPGSTPISVPMKTPTKQYSRLSGCNAMPKPDPRYWSMSMASPDPQQPGRQRTPEPDVEHEIRRDRAQKGRDDRGL